MTTPISPISSASPPPFRSVERLAGAPARLIQATAQARQTRVVTDILDASIARAQKVRAEQAQRREREAVEARQDAREAQRDAQAERADLRAAEIDRAAAESAARRDQRLAALIDVYA